MLTPTRFVARLKLLRVKDWSVQNGVFLLGAFFADDFFCRSPVFMAVSLALACLCLAYAYSLNEYYDVLKEKLVEDPRASAEIFQMVYFFLAAALGLSCLVSLKTMWIVIAIGITVWLHSSPPFHLKRHLIWRLVLNSLGFGLFFLAGASLDNRLTAGELLMGVFIFTLYLPLELIHVLAHMKADQAKGLPTFAHIYGESKTILLAVMFLAGLVSYSGMLWRWKFVSVAFALWSGVNLLLLLFSLLAAYKRENNPETYAKLRFRAKLVCAAYGAGLLAIFFYRL